MSMRLARLHFPQIIHYDHASHLQNRLVAALLAYKASSAPTSSPPDPTVVTAQFHPIYTCGRREIGTVSPSQQDYLCADGRASFAEALRGGQTTFHGPGQLVAYPVIDLKRHGISPRNYVRLLETTVINTCAGFGIKGFTTENPGVWTTEEKKIAAVGVHLRRNVSSHGIGLNVSTDLWWFNRIVACGLEGKKATSFEAEGVLGKDVDEVGDGFVRHFARGLGIEDVYMLDEKDVPS